MTGKNNSKSEPVMRFQGLMGAIVTVGVTDTGEYGVWYWHCNGCIDSHDDTNMDRLRDSANEHAATCRALPPEHAAA
ncbi:hypothetical protein ABH931_005532 [Streptacidiphilus sp. MAP12-33]|uniref:hypothetical protein n=1 Tax=Streptacidiphilus sp. MAP12-33 TaxID=3156266 RepID=UPI003513A5BC